MGIVESWEDEKGRVYAIIRQYKRKWGFNTMLPFVVTYPVKVGERGLLSKHMEIESDFDTLAEARDFLLKGIEQQDKDPGIGREMPKG